MDSAAEEREERWSSTDGAKKDRVAAARATRAADGSIMVMVDKTIVSMKVKAAATMELLCLALKSVRQN